MQNLNVRLLFLKRMLQIESFHANKSENEMACISTNQKFHKPKV